MRAQANINLTNNDLKVIYDLKHNPTEIVVKYDKFLKLLEYLEDKQIEKELKARMQNEEFVSESEIFDV